MLGVELPPKSHGPCVEVVPVDRVEVMVEVDVNVVVMTELDTEEDTEEVVLLVLLVLDSVTVVVVLGHEHHNPSQRFSQLA